MSVNKKIKITAEAHAGRGYIRITDIIGTYSETGSAAVIRAAVDAFLAQGIKGVSLYISSGGGSVFETSDICHELDRFGPENVDLYLGSLAASAVTYMVAKYYTTADPSTKLMIHRPEANIHGNVDAIESELKLLTDLTDDYRRGYAVKTGLTEGEVEALWNKGDLWLTAQQALEMKLINAIGKPVHTPQAVHDNMVQACLTPEEIENSEEINSNNEMDKLKIISALGLAADATDEQIINAAQQAKQDADRLTVVNAQAQEAKKMRGAAIVAKAILDKKITAEVKQTYENWAAQDPDAVEAVINAMTPVPQLSKVIGDTNLNQNAVADRKDWSYAKWQDEDPEGLSKLHDEQPEEFEKLLNTSI
ncbi:hypothetical protein KO02_16385 [Sphingobacterium sp. ML3W]|uniref:ATP-dependent Clp protease proteolytic subunit n=1 Tax=Sphingobacterium sp. ML3W TaxID=1538644 RepID=UPI0004F5FD1B|nr:ATP-dependent Clp protease proteolytic subunit [Sphingobacterium sp. ML3W]AIM38085.1 hypothetical protein KO02_16385 [Sphingobacterium sp. ML3W]